MSANRAEGRFEHQVAGHFTVNETFDAGGDPAVLPDPGYNRARDNPAAHPTPISSSR
jgi:hypothetical protein